jgi:branched-chain amino acid transport system substrate-binding protein
MRLACNPKTRLALAALTSVFAASAGMAQSKYDPGVTDTEIKLGQTMPYSGPASSFSLVGRVMTGYFKMLNDEQGGINGRKVTLLSLDDAFSPPKAVEQTRQLVERDGVFAIAGSFGSPSNLAIAKYLNTRKVPQVLVLAGAPKLDDPVALPFTTMFYSSPLVEGRIYADYLLAVKPSARIAVLYQNDDFGRNYLAGLKSGLAGRATLAGEFAYNLTDTTVDSQILTMRAAGADVVFLATTPKFTAQAIRKMHELRWSPLGITVTAARDFYTALEGPTLDSARGYITSLWLKQVGDPLWDTDVGMKEYLSFFSKYLPGDRPDDGSAIYAYSGAQLIAEALRRCGNELTHANLMTQISSIRDFQLPMFVPGVVINFTPDSRVGWRQARMARFDGVRWEMFGDLVSAGNVTTGITMPSAAR